MPQRILYIHGIDAIGGAERDVIALLKRLDRQRWEPHIACPNGGPLQSLVSRIPVPLHPLELPPWRKWSMLWRRRSAVAKLRALVSCLQPSLIHVNDIWWVPHTINAVSNDLLQMTPVVAHVRQEIEPRKVRRYTLERLDAVIAISRQVEQALIAGGVTRGRVQTIYSGLDLPAQEHDGRNSESIRRELGVPREAVLLGTVANLFPRKGYDIMLRALPEILAVVPSVHYVIVGSGEADYAESLRAFAQKLEIADRIHFVGFQDPVRPYLAALDLYVHPALMEGFGIAVVEAMGMGKAVVASRTGGLPEVVEHDRTGLLVPPGDATQLSAAVLSLLKDPQRREQMGVRGMTRVRERFDVQVSVTETERLYQSVLTSRQDG